jgi:NAD(P)-dependent dehydrogenase (short-subunit alcohol dehydrogenase family)
MPHISERFKLLIGMSFELDKLRLGSLFGHFQDSGPWFGLGQEQHWDPVLAVFLADRISYPVWEDQASFECVQSLLQVYSEGFEVGFFSGSDGLYLPYGYTAYYPIARTSFEELKSFFTTHEFDVVLNMSGLKYDVFLSKISEEDQKSINDMIDVNIKGNINIVSTCLPKMIEKKYGRIISISSVFSELNVPKNSIYCATKAFVDRFISNANKENIKYGITCNSIQLGYWDGGMCHRVEEKYQEMAKEKIGLKRWGSIEELYNTVNYIVDNEYVCGVNLRIDGGL